MTLRDQEMERQVHNLHEREQHQQDMDRFSYSCVPAPEFGIGQQVTVNCGKGPFQATIYAYGWDEFNGCASYWITVHEGNAIDMVVPARDVAKDI